jgi:hypothetical protein|tara:strand:- start:127 stop:567 length:441 start_codon:yes stop_codon:yes gene_type:complete
MERVIVCPKCLDTDRCFEEVQETFSSYLCFNCGYMSDSRYKVDDLNLIEKLKNSPKLVQDTKFEDKERGIVWFLSVINMGELGMIFPEGNPVEYVWKYAKVVEIPEEERAKYNNYDRRLDVENSMTFGQYEFLKACEELGITKDLK